MRFQLTSVTLEQVSACRSRLACWQTPDDFNGEVSAFIKPLSRGEFFNVPALAFLRDAWTLGKFASLAGAEAVKLSLDNFPDGHTKLGSEQLDIEITEAIMPDRRRGQEFLPGSPQMEEDPGHEWDRRISALPQVLLSTVRKKAMKAYSAKPTLVVYLNISAYGHRAGECRAAIRATIRAFSASFAGLYVLWGDELFGPM